MTLPDPHAFAQKWRDAWNRHDLDAILAHFAEDVVFTSPVAAQLLEGSDGVVVGKPALRAYWAEGLRRIPDLEFEVIGVYTGTGVLVIHYRNQRRGLVCEVLRFEDGLVVEGHGTYLDAVANPAGAR